MNMAGMGSAMMKYLMKKQNVLSLEQMFREAGAATFVAEANESSIQFFI
jgi:peroxiredoxin family protein